MSDVFISHSSKDSNIAAGLVEFLESKGISCWIASRNIAPGDDWAASISNAITSSKVFLLVYSENSAVSEQCPREVSLAETTNGVIVVPYKTDNAPLTGAYQYYLNGAHWITANVANNDMKYDELYAFLSGILGKTGQTINANTYIDTLNIQSSSVYNEQPKNKCPHCGMENEDGAVFCNSCGYRLSGTNRQVPQPTNRPSYQPSSNTDSALFGWCLAVGIVSIFALALVTTVLGILSAVFTKTKKYGAVKIMSTINVVLCPIQGILALVDGFRQWQAFAGFFIFLVCMFLLAGSIVTMMMSSNAVRNNHQ